MAEMIPDRLPAASSQGEKRLFEQLQKLPDDVLVYYEPIIQSRYPDFVVILPSIGVLIIEVKGWYGADILGGDSNDIRLKIQGQPRTEAHPMRQARTYQFALQDECRKSRAIQTELMHADGPYAGKFRIPFGHFAVL